MTWQPIRGVIPCSGNIVAVLASANWRLGLEKTRDNDGTPAGLYQLFELDKVIAWAWIAEPKGDEDAAFGAGKGRGIYNSFPPLTLDEDQGLVVMDSSYSNLIGVCEREEFSFDRFMDKAIDYWELCERQQGELEEGSDAKVAR